MHYIKKNQMFVSCKNCFHLYCIYKKPVRNTTLQGIICTTCISCYFEEKEKKGRKLCRYTRWPKVCGHLFITAMFHLLSHFLHCRVKRLCWYGALLHPFLWKRKSWSSANMWIKGCEFKLRPGHEIMCPWT